MPDKSSDSKYSQLVSRICRSCATLIATGGKLDSFGIDCHIVGNCGFVVGSSGRLGPVPSARRRQWLDRRGTTSLARRSHAVVRSRARACNVDAAERAVKEIAGPGARMSMKGAERAGRNQRSGMSARRWRRISREQNGLLPRFPFSPQAHSERIANRDGACGPPNTGSPHGLGNLFSVHADEGCCPRRANRYRRAE